MHLMDARALRRKDAFRGERPWEDLVCDPWISDREMVSMLHDPVSCGEPERIGGFQKKKDEALFIDSSRSSLIRFVGSARKWELWVKPLGVDAF
ncbi:hypothetical protein E6C27_scaffold404G00980 [Cucumis melo var. makuwa]|uniref:Uncharacterized protein n=1 Tax=Cucumis melo var. makuwa TaxID=1194695 RepID=A0A5A7UB38_CUCMM|nr:hypothetical protein E6C27_scaffold404G00980 [Cucumis melo var. makuwa]